MSERTYTRQDVDDIVAPWLKLCKEQSDELAELRKMRGGRISVLEAELFSLKEKAWLLVLSAEFDADISVVCTDDLECLKAALQEKGE